HDVLVRRAVRDGRSVRHRGDGEGERVGVGVYPTVVGAAVVHQLHSHVRAAVDARLQHEGEPARGRVDGRTRAEQAVVVRRQRERELLGVLVADGRAGGDGGGERILPGGAAVFQDGDVRLGQREGGGVVDGVNVDGRLRLGAAEAGVGVAQRRLNVEAEE